MELLAKQRSVYAFVFVWTYLSRHHFCCQLLCSLYVLPKTFTLVSSEMHGSLFEANSWLRYGYEPHDQYVQDWCLSRHIFCLCVWSWGTYRSCLRQELDWIHHTFEDCPVLWQSKLQTEMALSTVEAIIIALSACCRELFLITDMAKSVKLPIGKTTMNVSMYEVNLGALVLAKTLHPQFTPQSKDYTIKMIWFHKEIFKRGVQLHKINTIKQLGGIFTKGLTHFSNIYN